MLKLTDTHRNSLYLHGGKVSQKLTDVVYGAHQRKVIIHNKHETQLVKFPLLMVIVVFLLFPIIVGAAIWILFLYGGNLIVEKE